MAVDASGGPSDGDIYVADNGSQVVRKYDPAGNLITSWGDNGVLDGSTTAMGPFGAISGVAVGPDGTLYVGSTTESSTVKTSSSSSTKTAPSTPSMRSTARFSPSGSRSTATAMSSTSSYGEHVERYNGVTSTEISTGQLVRARVRPRCRSQQRRSLCQVSVGESIGPVTPSTSSGRVLQPNASPCNSALRTDRDIRRRRGLGCGRAGRRSVQRRPLCRRRQQDPALRCGRAADSGPDTGVGRLSSSTSLAVGGDGSALREYERSPAAPTSPRSARSPWPRKPGSTTRPSSMPSMTLAPGTPPTSRSLRAATTLRSPPRVSLTGYRQRWPS